MSRIGRALWRQIETGQFESPATIRSFALQVSFRSVIATSLAGCLLLPVLYAAAFVSIPIDEMVRLMVAFSWLFAGVLSGGLAFVTGHVIRDLLRSRREFEQLSRTDSLSGLANRRAFNETFSNLKLEGSLVILDIDRFKSINDRFGHQAGDRVIQAISAEFRDVFGKANVVARLGGEEFGVVLSDGTIEERLCLVEEARRRVAANSVSFGDTKLFVTISAGVAEIRVGRPAEVTYAWADKALYLAKQSGRDRVMHENALAILDHALFDHAPDDARLFAAIGQRD